MSSHQIKFFLLLFSSIKIAELSEVQSNKLEIVQGASTETTLQIFWFLPLTVTNPSTYEAKIASNERHLIIKNIRHWNNKTTSGDATFYPLTPGKFYNVTVKVQIKNGTDFIIKNTKEFQLAPMIPSNVTINHASITDTSFELNWDVPAILSEFDGYKITIFDNKKTVRSALLLKREKSRIFKDLNPRKKYTIVMKTYAKNLESSSVIRNILTLDPISSIPMEIKILNETNLLINWEDEIDFNDKNFLITHTRKDTGETIQKLTNQPNVVLDKLYPGAAYKLRIFRMDNDNEEIIGHGNAFAPPNPPTNVIVKEIKINDFSALITWNAPTKTIFDGYAIFMGTEDDVGPTILETIENNSTNQFELTNLMPGTLHVFRVAAMSFGVESLNFNDFVNYTVPPAPPSSVNLTAISSKEIQASFCNPEGNFDTYQGNFSEYHHPNLSKENFNILSGKHGRECKSVNFVYLRPCTIHKFSIWTVSHDIPSAVKNLLVVTPGSDCRQNVVADNITEPSVKIKFDRNFYNIMKS